MYWNIIDENRYKLLKDITEVVSIPNYYMIGGRGAKKEYMNIKFFIFFFYFVVEMK